MTQSTTGTRPIGIAGILRLRLGLDKGIQQKIDGVTFTCRDARQVLHTYDQLDAENQQTLRGIPASQVMFFITQASGLASSRSHRHASQP